MRCCGGPLSESGIEMIRILMAISNALFFLPSLSLYKDYKGLLHLYNSLQNIKVYKSKAFYIFIYNSLEYFSCVLEVEDLHLILNGINWIPTMHMILPGTMNACL